MFNVCPECGHAEAGERLRGRSQCAACGAIVAIQWVERRRPTHWSTRMSVVWAAMVCVLFPIWFPFYGNEISFGVWLYVALLLALANGHAVVGVARAPTVSAWFASAFAFSVGWAFLMLVRPV